MVVFTTINPYLMVCDQIDYEIVRIGWVVSPQLLRNKTLVRCHFGGLERYSKMQEKCRLKSIV